MSYVPHHPHSSSFTQGLLSAIRVGVVEGLKGFANAIRTWRARRVNYALTRELLEMDDAMLRDIGITPGDVRLALRDNNIDPTQELSRIALARRRAPLHLIR